MTLNQRYRIHSINRPIRYLKLFFLIAMIFVFSYTFSSYSSDFSMLSDFDVAKWKVVINGVEVTNQNKNVSLENKIKLVATPEDEDGIIKAGQEGYFDVVINPAGTEVSAEYTITMDFSSMPEQIEMKQYSTIKNGVESSKYNVPTNNNFSGDISIDHDNGKIKLTDNDSITYRIYWEWKGQNYQINYDDYEVRSRITVQQKIG